MAKKSKTKTRLAERRRKEAKRKRLIFGSMIIGGLLLLSVAGWAWWDGQQEAEAASQYSPEDINYDQPIHAVHEMESGPPIPFLPRAEAQPSIAANEKFFNFGSVGPNEVVTREFIIKNTGDAALTISRAYTTCGCTTADFTSSVIPPGKVSIMTLVFDAGFHDARGQTVRRGVIIENNDRSNSNVEIWVQASVRTSQ
jgi:hypothetical protein